MSDLRYENFKISLRLLSGKVSKKGEQARLARAKRESALPIGPLRGDISPLKYLIGGSYVKVHI